MLAALLNFGLDDDNRLFFSAHNMDSHQRIADAIFSKYNVRVPVFPLNPMPGENYETWLEQHQEMHNAFNNILGLEQFSFNSGALTSQEDIEAFAQSHFENHMAAHQKLGIPE